MKSMTQRARHLVTLALIGILCFQVPVQSFAQVGQTAMSQPVGVANGVVNRGLGALGNLNDAGPGFFYYGVNGAGRGLGYFGSYMTLGGFIPYAQDDLGGFWAADLRTHLSTNGGFFSNVGVVRKQLTDSGSLLGFGLYWDYDGDMNQYAGTGNTQFGQFGHVYQQIGVSGEYVTDRGAIRSNGYMPVGTTAYNAGAPGTPWHTNMIMCAYGLDAALGGADLEVGAWIPRLEAFGGMISVGGYTYGNANEWSQGTEIGDRMVPFFGGVYTRFDMTVANNWDINLQYNNDPFFDSTGFARLTYRMGGSRRRNVPDRLEQPMMRNEHIVRAHQTPEYLTNTQNNGTPWNVIHVDNTAAAGGDGTAEAPFTNLADADNAATREWDIVYVHEGNSRVAPNFYGDSFSFNQDNQFLVGSGGPLTLAVGSSCGTFNAASGAYLFTVPAQSTNNPLLSNPGGTSISTDGNGGLTIANLDIVGSGDAMLVSANGTTTPTPFLNVTDLNGTRQPFGTTANPYNSAISVAGGTSVRNVNIAGNGTAAIQRGVRITLPDDVPTVVDYEIQGGIEFTDTTIANMTRAGLSIDNTRGNGADEFNVSYDGRIVSDIANTGGITSPLINIENNEGISTFDIAVGSPPAGSLITTNELSDVGGQGIIIQNNTPTVTNNLGNVSLTNNVDQAIYVFNDSSTTNIQSDAGAGIIRDNTITGGQAILVNDDGSVVASLTKPAPVFSYLGTINNSAADSYLLYVNGSNEGEPELPNPSPPPALLPAAPRGSITLQGPGATPFEDTGSGILLQSVDATVSVSGASLASTGPNAISINGGSGAFSFNDVNITGGTQSSVLIVDRAAASDTTTFSNLTINNPNTTAFGLQSASGGTITIGGISSIETASTTLSAIQTFDNGNPAAVLNFTLQSVTSANTNVSPWANPPFGAISLANSSGDIRIQSVFDVGGSDGTGVNVENTSTVNVYKQGLLISP
ncbi:inverse autotransporter beta domain-containing protein [Planctomycetaceae bacterium]|nr:inverse autotransporter beta domain-containing protein [Planctomycetaceae bacterium]